MTAIITDVKYRMSLALIRTLGEKKVKIIACESEKCRNNKSSPPLGFYSKHCSESVYLSEENYADELYALCERVYHEDGERPSLITVGAATTALISSMSDRFFEVCNFMAPTVSELDRLNDKAAMAKLALEVEVPVPHEYTVENAEFPCVIKPVCGEKLGLTAKDRYVIARNSSELNDAVARFSAYDTELVIQEYLSGGGYGCSVFALDGQVLSYICHKRIREYPISGGPSACCISLYDDRLIKYAEALTKSVGFSGIAMFEFKADAEGMPRFLECNPRIWGSFPLVRVAGGGMILRWFSVLCESAPDEFFEIKDFKERKMHFVVSDLLAAVSYLKKGRIGKFFAVIFDCLNPFVREGLFEFRDPKPFFVYFKGLFNR